MAACKLVINWGAGISGNLQLSNMEISNWAMTGLGVSTGFLLGLNWRDLMSARSVLISSVRVMMGLWESRLSNW